ncbi:hypothetical protein [Pseudoponticoccus marisrubri]|uniref:Lipoprotein n=1 Tax=Pseudoponticoccus marisrubri TaxID=1685382 RepID=A0A0W7WGP1_9RHOB|nr:hypothetical protein [Pseudoponticoccus marisrubri]KUF09795.1 hypothetical protein AVJ23_15195 [Pseudoponticoccus marisrubri]
MRPWVLIGLAVLAVSACGDPLRDVPRLQDVEVADETGRAEALPAEEAPESVVDTPPEPAPAAERPRGGLLGFLRRQADAGRDSAPTPAPEPTVAAQPAPEPEETAPDPAPRRGLAALFGGGGGGGGRAPEPGAPDYRQVPLGTTLPYGEIARVCDVPERRLGRKVNAYPESGRGGYTLYDSAPDTTGQRSFYLTGFGDGCARQFSAALVLFGAPSTYEQIRYAAGGAGQPTAETDIAYEELKSRVCRVGRGQPCGDRIGRLERNTVFVSVYERFGSNARWKNILLHDGEVVALDMKS